MGCNCGKNKQYKYKNGARQTVLKQTSGVTVENERMDDDLVLIQYNSPNKGQHGVRGSVTGTFYGYRKGGDRFLVSRQDVAARPHLFHVIEAEVQVPPNTPSPPPPPITSTTATTTARIITGNPDAPVRVVDVDLDETKLGNEPEIEALLSARDFPVDLDLQAFPGITPAVERAMRQARLSTAQAILDAGLAGLVAIKGIGEVRAKTILAYTQEKYGD